MRRKATPYLFILPFFILFFVFMIGPALYALYAGLTRWQGTSSPGFVGIMNYTRLIKDPTFRLSLVNTLWYFAVSTSVIVPLALLMASLLNIGWIKARGLFRTIYFVPSITPAVVIGAVFALAYDRDYGPVNWALQQIGLPAVEWLTAKWFKTAVASMVIWRWSGHHMVYFLAGLQNIPKDLYEAARVDGANAWQRFSYITIPSIKPITTFVLVMMTISSLQIFAEPFMLLHDGRGFGGPSDSGLSIVMYLYRTSFLFMKRGYGSALGSVLFALILAFSLVQAKSLGLFGREP